MQRRFWSRFVASLFVSLTLIPVVSHAAPVQASRIRVAIQGFAFRPAALRITTGTTVTWTNRDLSDHNVTQTRPSRSFRSGTLHQNQSFSITFRKAGSYTYVCTIHPGMQGTIHVVAP